MKNSYKYNIDNCKWYYNYSNKTVNDIEMIYLVSAIRNYYMLAFKTRPTVYNFHVCVS